MSWICDDDIHGKDDEVAIDSHVRSACIVHTYIGAIPEL